jgi:hypothetical protein
MFRQGAPKYQRPHRVAGCIRRCLPLIWIALSLRAYATGIEVPTTVTNRLISIRVLPPTNAAWVKLSQDPEFRKSNGVVIELKAVQTNLQQATVSITYPNGKAGGRGAPAGLPVDSRDLRILLVPARLSDGGDIPPYATNGWFERMMFSESAGPDARNVPNSVRSYWSQNSYGRVRISGEVYPGWVTVRESAYYSNLPITQPPTALAQDVVNRIKQVDPGYFRQRSFDFLVLLLPGDFGAVYNSFYEQTSFWSDTNGIFKGYLIMDLPVDWSSKYFGPVRGEAGRTIASTVYTKRRNNGVEGVWLGTDIHRIGTNYAVGSRGPAFGGGVINLNPPLPNNTPVIIDYDIGYFTETNLSRTTRTVDTTYSIVSVNGVWLSTDTNRSGINYFNGGSFVNRDNHITLGADLPAADAAVVVEYLTGVTERLWDWDAPFFSADHAQVWFGTFLHEMAHGIGRFASLGVARSIGDLYLGADYIWNYGLMSGGNHQIRSDADGAWNEPAHLDGYCKYELGFLLPYELRYGENESNLTLYASEEFPYTARTKLVKVPLQPPAFFGRHRAAGRDYFGEEYLLLELRRKGESPQIHNFDRGLPNEGLLIYHVIERSPVSIGATTYNMVQVIDATPPSQSDWLWSDSDSLTLAAQKSFEVTPVPFGPESGVMRYVSSEMWQEIGNSNLTFRIDGAGSQTIYAKFRDKGTNESAVYSASTSYLPAAGADSNTNGIADAWELQYFGSLSTAADFPQQDADGDGMSNLSEFIAGTDPTHADSRLFFSVPQKASILRFSSVPGRKYLLWYSDNLGRSRWLNDSLGTPLSANGTTMTLQVSTNSRARFFQATVLE